MSRLALFFRLIVRPLFHEPVRTVLTVLAIALGVGVVLAIDLAGTAATGSFHSSQETLAGDNDLEITASEEFRECRLGTLGAMPFPIRISPRIEDYAVVQETNQSIPVLGWICRRRGKPRCCFFLSSGGQPRDALNNLSDYNSVWVGESLQRRPGDRISLLINDQVHRYMVRGMFPDSNGNARRDRDGHCGGAAGARAIRADRSHPVKVPQIPAAGRMASNASGTVLAPGVEVRLAGTGTNENRQMLAAFRWNLRLLSYIALVVGAFLIYNTISVSVVRRRAEIGIVRALGASRGAVLARFLGEAASFGFVGALIGLPLGRVMASGAVRLMATTVESLYVSSRPGPLELSCRRPWCLRLNRGRRRCRRVGVLLPREKHR